VSLGGIQKALAVSPEKGMSLAKSRAVALKDVAEREKLELGNRVATAKMLRDELAATDAITWPAWVARAKAAGLPAAQNAPAVFDPQWQMRNVQDADKFISQNTPKIELVDIGGERKAIDVNPVTNPAIRGTALAKTMTPAEKASEARAKTAATVEAGKATNIQENQMRDDFTRASVEFVKVRDAHQRVLESAVDPSAAGDLALIFNYMKVLDPGSTVREGEFATAQNSGGIPDIIRAKYNKVIAGERLAPDVRKDFVDRSERLYQGAVRNQEEIEKDYEGKSKGAGVRPEQVVTKHRVKPPKPSKDAPQAVPGGAFVDPEKERRYQEWKAKQR
jgi:hypothetical protein